MEAAGIRRRPGLGERSVFEWEDAWLGRYKVVSIDDTSVSFERHDAPDRSGAVPTYRFDYPEMERLVANGRVRLIDS
ncbi:hypothetical protein [Halalkalicoccus ordinarius]|uniref:hypothetical protein n=1 Tax=Halalkalicoccus ordinarius TaxID=3116651 RepID=UPI00300F31EE